MAEIALEKLTKVYPDGTRAVSELDLEIADGEFVVLVGPSGCGKTTALRMVAGLEEITDGVVKIGERIVNDLPPKDRDIAMVFQNYALYPHMSAYDNIAFGLKMRGVAKGVIARRVQSTAGLLGLGGTLGKKPRTLSGGQRQRVAMGRSIVREPQAFLMDEPLSNLDAKLRVQMRAEIARLQHDLEVTTIYVTHDQTEAMTMGERVAVMKDGFLQQVARPQELYDRPVNLFVAGFIGSPAMNLVHGELERANGGLAVRLGETRLDLEERTVRARPGLTRFERKTVVVGIRPEDLEDAEVVGGAQEGRRIAADVEVREDMGSEVYLHAAVDAPPVDAAELRQAVGDEAVEASEMRARERGTAFIARVDRATKAHEGARITLAVDTRHLHFFDPETGAGIYNSEQRGAR
jgi:multiple sugar transport system ATP-binding protein